MDDQIIFEILNITVLLAAFGGGIFAASLGIIGAFSISGVMILVGVAAAASGNYDIIGLAFGQYTGPHIAFASAVAATAYAGRMGLLDSGADVLTPLAKLKRFDVLLVGGIFGLFAEICQSFFFVIGLPIDTIALTVVISNLLARLIFGKSGLFGKAPKTIKPFPGWHFMGYNLVLGFGVGLISAYATMITGDVTIGFGFSAVTLIFLFYGDFPVTHHISISAAYAVATTGSLVIGGLFGFVAAAIGTLVWNLFNTDADTFIDPPAMTIAITSLFIFTVL